MGFADIVDQHCDIELMDEGLKAGIVGIVVGGKVHGEGLGAGAGVLGFDFLGEGGEFGGCARDEQDVEAGAGELEGIFLADAVGGAGNKGPGAFGAERAELVERMLVLGKGRGGKEVVLISLEGRIG